MAHEMDEFFAFAEEQQQRIFIDKYVYYRALHESFERLILKYVFKW